MLALAGKPGDAERWAAAAESSTVTGVLDDGNTVEATMAYIRAVLCRHGVETMRRDAEDAVPSAVPDVRRPLVRVD